MHITKYSNGIFVIINLQGIKLYMYLLYSAGGHWRFFQFQLPRKTQYVLFEAKYDTNNKFGDVAIDDVILTCKTCGRN